MLKAWKRTVDGSEAWWARVGTIVYIQDNARPFTGIRHFVKRAPWIIEAWLTREYGTYGGATYMANGHLAMVRCLRTGRRSIVADWIVKMSAEDA